MTTLMSLIKKETLEQIRTYKLAIVGGVFLLFGITTPIMLKYLPELIKLSGEDISVSIPPPTAIQALNEYAGTIGQVGLLIAVLLSMGAVANEIRHGTIMMTLSKPVSRSAFISAKLIVMSGTFTVSLILASAFCFVYTILLIEPANLIFFIYLNLLLSLFLIFSLAITLLFSSIFKSSLAAGGTAIAVLILQAVITSVPVIGKYMPGKLLTWGSEILNQTQNVYWESLVITIILVVLCLFLSQRVLKNKDL